jgi:PurA ssDNA and RNA-binding protein
MAGKRAGFVPENSEKKAMNFSSILCAECLNSRAQGKMDNIIEAKELQIERKHFYVELRENERGRFLRITEEAHGRRNSIIVPSTGVDDFTATISEVLANGEGAPA